MAEALQKHILCTCINHQSMGEKNINKRINTGNKRASMIPTSRSFHYKFTPSNFTLSPIPSPPSNPPKMASESETGQTQPRFRNRDLSLFFPFLLGIHGPDPDQNTPDPDPNSANEPDPEGRNERMILINPLTQAMVVIEGAALRDLIRVDPDEIGPRPASRASIEALPRVEIGEDEAGECVVCLEEWVIGGSVKEMPCKHRFHGGCIDKWLGIHGSCPVCRFEMGCDLDKRGGVWVSFSFSGSGPNLDRSSSDGGSELE